MPVSITDFLTANGFAIDKDSGYFWKWNNQERVKIPFTCLPGHTVESFAVMAREKGWVAEATAKYAREDNFLSKDVDRAEGIPTFGELLREEDPQCILIPWSPLDEDTKIKLKEAWQSMNARGVSQSRIILWQNYPPPLVPLEQSAVDREYIEDFRFFALTRQW